MKKSVTLIVSIIIMVVLALIAWTIANFSSADLEMTTRLLDSERALYLAESGAEWALERLANDSGFRTDEVHSLSYGEYRIICRDPEADEEGDVIIEAIGYVPTQSDFRAQRQIKVVVKIGGLNYVVEANNQFNWYLMHSGSSIVGDIVALYYNGDGDATFNESEDLSVPGSGERLILTPGTYPTIDLTYFEAKATTIWDNAKVTTALPSSSANILRVSQRDFFTGMTQEVVRNLTHNTWNDNDWAVIVRVLSNGRVAILDRNIGDTWDSDQIRLVKRFFQNMFNQNIYYVKGDVLLDLRNTNLTFWYTNIIAEQDIVIKGRYGILMTTRTFGESWPSLATKYGDILSLQQPLGSTELRRLRRRRFGGLIYSEQGEVSFNYLWGIGVMGNDVNFDGRIRLRYVSSKLDSGGFIFEPSVIVWREE
ncbi:MAG: hypothetical protein DRN12_07535 [Thermoplasmata archaeon]|nr:MAG: hypothetical protein DRN12_07535 [Thermoplasmata archaeon]